MSSSPIKNTDYTEEGQNPCSNAESGSLEKRLQIMPSELVKKCVTFSQVRGNFQSLILIFHFY